MPRVTFDVLPEDARVWIFSAERELTAVEQERMLDNVDRFIDQWGAHSVPLVAGRELQYGQFLFVAVDQRTAGPSGCSIDALVRQMKELENDLGVELVNHSPVLFRRGTNVERVSREDFAELVAAGHVGVKGVGKRLRIVDDTGSIRRNGEFRIPGQHEVAGAPPALPGRPPVVSVPVGVSHEKVEQHVVDEGVHVEVVLDRGVTGGIGNITVGNRDHGVPGRRVATAGLAGAESIVVFALSSEVGSHEVSVRAFVHMVEPPVKSVDAKLLVAFVESFKQRSSNIRTAVAVHVLGVDAHRIICCCANRVHREVLAVVILVPDNLVRNKISCEHIHVSNSHKYSLEESAILARAAGYLRKDAWTDDEGIYSLQLWQP